MAKSRWNLEKAKKLTKNFVGTNCGYYMIVTNEKTKQEGCAIITKETKVIVFEEKDEGRKYEIYSPEKFNKKYKLKEVYADCDKVKIEEKKGKRIAQTR